MIVPCPSCSARNRVPAARLTDAATCARCKTKLPLDKPWSIASAAELDELVQQATVPVLVDYWAAWCGPCRVVAPEVEALAREQQGRLIVAKVDTEAVPELAQRYTIRSIPTLMLFRQGREHKRVMGAMPRQAIAAQLGL